MNTVNAPQPVDAADLLADLAVAERIHHSGRQDDEAGDRAHVQHVHGSAAAGAADAAAGLGRHGGAEGAAGRPVEARMLPQPSSSSSSSSSSKGDRRVPRSEVAEVGTPEQRAGGHRRGVREGVAHIWQHREGGEDEAAHPEPERRAARAAAQHGRKPASAVDAAGRRVAPEEGDEGRGRAQDDLPGQDDRRDETADDSAPEGDDQDPQRAEGPLERPHDQHDADQVDGQVNGARVDKGRHQEPPPVRPPRDRRGGGGRGRGGGGGGGGGSREVVVVVVVVVCQL